jgi:hypothetical protein
MLYSGAKGNNERLTTGCSRRVAAIKNGEARGAPASRAQGRASGRIRPGQHVRFATLTSNASPIVILAALHEVLTERVGRYTVKLVD